MMEPQDSLPETHRQLIREINDLTARFLESAPHSEANDIRITMAFLGSKFACGALEEMLKDIQRAEKNICSLLKDRKSVH